MGSLIDGIIEKSGVPDLLDVLADKLSPGELQSLLLAVARRRAARLTPGDVLTAYRTSRFVRLAAVEPARQAAFDTYAYSLLPPGFEAVELAPVAPLGAVSAVSAQDQNNVLTTTRTLEVTADPTNVMALECALRRKALRGTERVRLATSARVLRTQVFDGPACFAHFRLLALATAGRDEGNHLFESEAALEHLVFHLALLRGAEACDLAVGPVDVRFVLYDPATAPFWHERIGEFRATGLPDGTTASVTEAVDDEQTYYRDFRFQIWAAPPSGDKLNLVDGGFTDWTRRLLSDRKERFLGSALGTERLLSAFRTT